MSDPQRTPFVPRKKVNELKGLLDDCMLVDRYRLSRKLRRLEQDSTVELAHLEKVEALIRSSIELAASRLRDIPKPQYDSDLPVTLRRDLILKTIQKNQVVIIAGETGSGKTTQIPKMCLELGRGHYGYIGHTQPRRIAARSIANRLAQELNSELGRYAGFKVRFSDHVNSNTHIKLMTDGILLAEIQHDRFLNAYDTIIIDEAHERSLNIDFILGYLKLILPKRPDLKIIITSATIDTQRFSEFFNNAPVVEVSGRTYPVEVLYQPLNDPDSDDTELDLQQGILNAVDALMQYPMGDILIFLSGEREIREAAEALRKHHPPHTQILPLYSRLSVAEQNRVFHSHTGRRIVLATNVAETSLTVPGIKYVIDSGTARISRYSYRSKVQRLPIERVSQASANQRKGRCGRTSEGVCVRLYTEQDFSERPEFTEPEIRRTNLAAVILQMSCLGLGNIEEFPFVQSPDSRYINDGYKLLYELQAVKKDRSISQLGRQIVKLPLDPKLARVLIAAKDLGCLSEALILCSALSCQDVKDRPLESQQAADQAHAHYSDKSSDLLFYVNLWTELGKQKKHLSNNKFRKFCFDNFVNYLRVREWQDLHRQLKQSVREFGWFLNQEPAEYVQVHTALLSGLLGNIGMKSDSHSFSGQRNITFHIHPSSGLYKKSPKWVMSSEIVETSKLYARNVAKIEPQWIETVAGHLLKKSYQDIHWEKRAGHVVAHESATLYGLTVYSRKKVNYGAIDSQESHKQFICSALVDGDWFGKYDFVTHNENLIKELEQEEAKNRRHDILVDKSTLEEFFTDKIPLTVNNAAAFKKWYPKSEACKGKLLFYSQGNLVRDDSLFAQGDQFPSSMQFGKYELDLSYCFEPGNPMDGVTAKIPISVLDQLSPHSFGYLVPGMLKEKVVALIKALPKELRKSFVPAPQFAQACLDIIGIDRSRSLVQAVGDALFKISGVRVDKNLWNIENLPNQMLMNYRVVDEQGNELAQGKDLEQLKLELGSYIQNVIDEIEPVTSKPETYKSWSFPDLKQETTVKSPAGDVVVYPALVDDGDKVTIKNFSNQHQARSQHREGVYRLFTLESNSNIKYFQKNIPDFQQICLLYANVDSCDSLKEELLEILVKELLFEKEKDIRTKVAYSEASYFAKQQLVSEANRLSSVLLKILLQYKKVKRELESVSSIQVMESIQDMLGQLDWLVYPGFLLETPYQWIYHIPRYLDALAMRLQKLQQGPKEDLKRLELVQEHWQNLLHSYEECGNEPEWIQYRWMVEEMRVSVFAQQLKTSLPVSSTRLEKLWAKITE